MPLTNKQYRKRDEVSCPFCNGQDLEWNDLTVDGKEVTQQVYCLDCEIEWQDVYKLTGYRKT